MTVFFDNDANDSIISAFDTELKNANSSKNMRLFTRIVLLKNNVDIVGKRFYGVLGFNPLQNSFDIHLKGDYVNADSIKKLNVTFVKTKWFRKLSTIKNWLTW